VSEFKTHIFFYKLLSLRALAALSACPQKEEGESARGVWRNITLSIFKERNQQEQGNACGVLV